jgi:methionine-rich copper-binding protein CopC
MLSSLVLTLTAVSAVLPAPAHAHFDVKSTSPGKGKTASTSLRAVKVTFTGPVRSGTLRVTGPGGTVVSIGGGARDASNIARVRVRLKQNLSGGGYKARWTAIAADGHEQEGSFGFKLQKP